MAMLSKTLQNAMNDQIKNELYSAYLYLSMSAYFESLNLPGFAHWMRVQAQEEVEHAMKFFDFIHERGGTVTLQAIDQPPAKFKSPLDAFQAAYEHEQEVSKTINEIYALAAQEKDYASQAFLDWFVTEQVEEEKLTAQVVEMLKRAGTEGPALLMLDQQLAARED